MPREGWPEPLANGNWIWHVQLADCPEYFEVGVSATKDGIGTGQRSGLYRRAAEGMLLDLAAVVAEFRVDA